MNGFSCVGRQRIFVTGSTAEYLANNYKKKSETNRQIKIVRTYGFLISSTYFCERTKKIRVLHKRGDFEVYLCGYAKKVISSKNRRCKKKDCPFFSFFYRAKIESYYIRLFCCRQVLLLSLLAE
jgi:hypothetical protein